MVKRFLLAVGLIVLLLLVFEIVGLLRLRSHLTTYAAYWHRQATEQGEFVYVALGDSAAQAIGASSPENGYVSLLAKQIGVVTGKRVRVVNLSVSGARVKDVVDKQLPELKQYRPDLVTVECGGNDVLHFNEASYRADYTKLVDGLPQGIFVANVPYFGGRKSGADATALLASQIATEKINRAGLNLVDLQTYTRTRNSPRNYSYDFFHPSNYGYRVWYAAFWDAIRPTLNQKR